MIIKYLKTVYLPQMFENILKAFVITSLTPKQIEHHCFASVDSEQLKLKGYESPWTLSCFNIDEEEMTSGVVSAYNTRGKKFKNSWKSWSATTRSSVTKCVTDKIQVLVQRGFGLPLYNPVIHSFFC